MAVSTGLQLLVFFGLFTAIAAQLPLPLPGTSTSTVNDQAACPTFHKAGCTASACGLLNSSYPLQFKAGALSVVTTPGVAQTPTTDYSVGKSSVQTFSECCTKCAATTGCSFWQFTPSTADNCYLFKDGVQSDGCTKTSSSANSKTDGRIGGKCNPNAGVTDDPHFTGAQGTKFDFSGLPDKSFCLLTDKAIHVNILLRGYLDTRTESATVMHEGKAVRTWIREIGFIWTAEGIEHKLRMVARSGVEQMRANGFLETVEMDGVSQIVPQVGRSLSGAGGFSLSLVALEKTGPYDVDFFSLKIGNLLDLSIRMRVANPLLQSPTDAEAHFNIGVQSMKQTDTIHGILGQTFRGDHAEKAEKYSKLAALLRAPVIADGVSGRGFLDGDVVKDYKTTSVLATDCTFSAYGEGADNTAAVAAN